MTKLLEICYPNLTKNRIWLASNNEHESRSPAAVRAFPAPFCRRCWIFSAAFGITDPALFGAAIRTSRIAGDQQAALVGGGASHQAMLKATYGTGCFMPQMDAVARERNLAGWSRGSHPAAGLKAAAIRSCAHRRRRLPGGQPKSNAPSGVMPRRISSASDSLARRVAAPILTQQGRHRRSASMIGSEVGRGERLSRAPVAKSRV